MRRLCDYPENSTPPPIDSILYMPHSQSQNYAYIMMIFSCPKKHLQSNQVIVSLSKNEELL